MPPESDSRTARSLLALLEDPASQAAWGRFVDRYAPRIYGWCCRRGLADACARDVTQLVLRSLFGHLGGYAPDRGLFRAWLHRMTRRAWRDCLRVHRHGAEPPPPLLRSASAGEELAWAMDEEFRRELLDVAVARVRPLVDPPAAWEAFRLTAREGVRAEEAALRLGISITAVYMARSRVQDMVRDEIARLEEAPPTREGI